jgi:hypothetical protein
MAGWGHLRILRKESCCIALDTRPQDTCIVLIARAADPKKVSVWNEFKRIEKVVEVNLCAAAVSGVLSSYCCLGNHRTDSEFVCNFA